MLARVGKSLALFALLASSALLLYLGDKAHTSRDAFAQTIELLAQRAEQRDHVGRVPSWATPPTRSDLIAEGLRALMAATLSLDRVQTRTTGHMVTIDVIPRAGARVRIYADAAGNVYRVEPLQVP